MWQSWQPAFTPVRFTAWTLFLYSAATHCIEWHAVLQNSLVPVAWTITCVPTVATRPTTMPITRSASTDHFGLGLRNPRQVRLMKPPLGSAIRPPLVPVVDQEIEDVRGVLRARVRPVEVAVLVGGPGDHVQVAVHLRVAVVVLLVGVAAGEGPHLREGVRRLQVEGFLLGVVPRWDGRRAHHRGGHALLQRQVHVAV